MADERDELDAIMDIVAALGERDDEEKLFVLLTTWLSLAANARQQKVTQPNGFDAERDRQIKQLERAIELLRADMPDAEGERLFRSGDLEAWSAHMRRQIRGSGTH